MELITIKSENIIARIVPEYGGNLCKVTAYGYDVIDFSEEWLENKIYTGTPVLYPTPNIAENASFIWEGKQIVLCKNGKMYDCHGVVHDEKWNYEKINESVVNVWLDFKKGTELYNSFPFEHRISIKYTALNTGISVEYKISNFGDEKIPFGFGIHPYFQKLCSDISFKISSNNIMESVSEDCLIPTGKLTQISSFERELRDFTGGTVFTSLNHESTFEIFYKEIGLKVKSSTSKDFDFIVLYHPFDEAFFCIENQTTAVNAHNLSETGIVSGLQVCDKESQGQVKLLFEMSAP